MAKHDKVSTITKTAILVGRNNTPVPPDEVELMASIGCTDREIAEYFGINDDTLRYNLKDFLINGRQRLKNSLRKAQLRVALDGNATLLIWLGKQILGQQENPTNTDDVRALPWSDDEDSMDVIDVEDLMEENTEDIE
jgi:hypothetical protein